MSRGTSGSTRSKTCCHRHPLDGDEAAPDERTVDGVDDVHAVGEVVQPERVQVQLTSVRRIAGEEARVPVAWAEQRDDPQQPDEQLVARDARSAARELVDLRPEALTGHAPEGCGVDLLDRCTERANVAGERHRGGRAGLRR